MAASLMACAARISRWRIAVEFDEFDRRAQERRRLFGLGGSLRRRAVGRRFAARTDDEVSLPAGPRFLRDDAAAAEFDVVGVRAKGQQRARVQAWICV